jgi:hypothetical protein
MQCPYCSTDYTCEEPCLCLPANFFTSIMESVTVGGPWGEAAKEWSLPTRTCAAWIMPVGEA